MHRPGQNLDELSKYGIYSDQDLINAKALQTGRLAMGSALVSMAAWAWMTGRMTGNGPVDRQKRQTWLDADTNHVYFLRRCWSRVRLV